MTSDLARIQLCIGNELDHELIPNMIGLQYIGLLILTTTFGPPWEVRVQLGFI